MKGVVITFLTIFMVGCYDPNYVQSSRSINVVRCYEMIYNARTSRPAVVCDNGKTYYTISDYYSQYNRERYFYNPFYTYPCMTGMCTNRQYNSGRNVDVPAPRTPTTQPPQTPPMETIKKAPPIKPTIPPDMK